MKKRILILGIIATLFAMLFILTGCGENNEEINQENEVEEVVATQELDVKALYLEVLDGKRSYTNTEENKEGTIDDSLSLLVSDAGSGRAKISYTMLNMNHDEIEDMVAFIEGDWDGNYLILTYENETIYGVIRSYRGIGNLKTNGYYTAAGGADVGGYYEANFEKGQENSEEIASRNNGLYKIGNQTVSLGELEAYIEEEFNHKENVTWTEYRTIEPGTESLEIKEGTYTYTRPNEGKETDGSICTLTIKEGRATWVDNYFDITKTGTYTINGDTVVVNYTYKKYFNQGADREEEETISEQESYSFDGIALMNLSTKEAYL